MPSSFSTIAIVGAGLIGGSLARLIRDRFPESEIWAVDREDVVAELEKEGSVFSFCVSSLSLLPSYVDLIIVATPIGAIRGVFEEISQWCTGDVVVTDVASVKGDILDWAKEVLPAGASFVGGHPIAGREVQGFSASSADLLSGARYVLVQDESSAYGVLKAFLEALDCQVVEMTAELHDRVFALMSHFPYLAACMAVKVLDGADDQVRELALELAGSGFKDTTRIAASSCEWGSDVSLANSDALVDAIDDAQQVLGELKRLLNDGQGAELLAFFNEVSTTRRSVS